MARICIGPRALQEISDKFDQNIRVMLKFRIFLIYSEETEKKSKWPKNFIGPRALPGYFLAKFGEHIRVIYQNS